MIGEWKRIVYQTMTIDAIDLDKELRLTVTWHSHGRAEAKIHRFASNLHVEIYGSKAPTEARNLAVKKMRNWATKACKDHILRLLDGVPTETKEAS